MLGLSHHILSILLRERSLQRPIQCHKTSQWQSQGKPQVLRLCSLVLLRIQECHKSSSLLMARDLFLSGLSFLSGSLSSFISLHRSCFQKLSICCFPGKGISYKLQHSKFSPNVVDRNSYKPLLYYCIAQFWWFGHPQGPKQAAWGLGSFLRLQSNCWSRLQLLEGLTTTGDLLHDGPLV